VGHMCSAGSVRVKFRV